MLNNLGFNETLMQQKNNLHQAINKNELKRRYRHDQPFTSKHNEEDYNE
jgi:hypothetical protein